MRVLDGRLSAGWEAEIAKEVFIMVSGVKDGYAACKKR